MRIAAASRLAAVSLALTFAAPIAVHAADSDPSIKQGFEEVGRGIANDSKKGWDATKDATKEGWDATKRGTGTALQKTGEGIDKTGTAVEGAGDHVKDDVEK